MLKYGVLSYHKVKLNLDGKDYLNLGDWIQTIAMEELYKEWNITDYIYVNRNDASVYNGPYVVLPYNCYHSFTLKLHDYNYAFPLSSRIIPVFFSLHLQDGYIPPVAEEQFRSSTPIGCRDEETLSTVRKYSIPAFLSGCITALFPRRKVLEQQKRVILVDAPAGIEAYMPQELLSHIEYRTHIYNIVRTDGQLYTTEEEARNSYNKAKELLYYYRDNAALVVTQRLHVASPCMAMGIPTILVRDDGFDGRYSWIDKFLPLYTKKDFDRIDWNPPIIEYEEQKKVVKEILKNQINEVYIKNKEWCNMSEFWENRERKLYNDNVIKAISKLNIEGNENFALWGVVAETHVLKRILLEKYPNMKLTAVYDLNIKGDFEGITIKLPNEIMNDDIIYFVVARGAFLSAKDYLERLNNKFVLAEFKENSWQNNL